MNNKNLKFITAKAILAILGVLCIIFGLLTIFDSGNAKEAMEDGRRVIHNLRDNTTSGNQRIIDPSRFAVAEKKENKKSRASALGKEEETVEVAKKRNTGLRPTPNPALLDENGLPKIAEDGTKPMDYYARPFASARAEKPMIAVVFRGVGLSHSLSEPLLDLPFEVNLAISPYSASVEGWMTQSRDFGHETLLEIPLEPHNFPIDDAGANSLLTSLDDEEFNKRLSWLLGRAQTYVGLFAPSNEKFMTSDQHRSMLLNDIKKRGLLFLHSSLHSKDAIKKEKILSSDVVADLINSPEDINAYFNMAEATARKKGYAILVLDPYPITVKELLKWLDKFDSKGLSLAPISAIEKRRSGEI
jgi:polysaccharide deacetylase 2 family uncharacterized protein YibQ